MTPVRISYWPSQRVQEKLVPRDTTIAEMLVELAIPNALVRVGGHIVPADWHGRVRPKSGVLVEVIALPGNFGVAGGLIPSTTLRLALGVLSSGLGLLTQVAIGGVGGQLLGGAVNIGGLLLTNAIVPPAQLPLDEVGYSLQGSRNQLRPYGNIPRIFGRVRVYPDLAAPPYTEIGNDNSQFLRLLFCVGHGRLRLSDLRIGDTSIDRFEGVEWEALQGAPGDEFQSTIFANASMIDEQQLNLTLDTTPIDERSGTAQGGSLSTIVLDAGASGQDDYYVGMTVDITGGTGSPQTGRTVTAYNGSTKTATVTANWSIAPDATSQFVIRDPKAWKYQTTKPDTVEISLDISFLQGLQARRSDGVILGPVVEFEIQYRLKGNEDVGPDESFQTAWTRLSYPDQYRPHDPSSLGNDPLQTIEDRIVDLVANLEDWADTIEFALGSGDRNAPAALIASVLGILNRILDRLDLIQEQVTLDVGVIADVQNAVTRLRDIFDEWGVTTFQDMTDEAREAVDAAIRRVPVLGDLLEINRYITMGNPDDLREYLRNAPTWVQIFYGYQGLDDILGGFDELIVVHSGTATAGGATTITLDAAASENDNAYKGMTVEITAGTGSGQVRTISSYIGSTKVATTTESWSVNPNATSEFRILENDTIIVEDNSSAIVRRTFRWRPAQGPGIYQVRIRRITPTDRTFGGELKDASTLTAFRSIFTGTPPVLREGLALVAMRIRASDQLSGIIEQFNLVAESFLPVWNGSQWTEQLTRNPAWAYCDILRNAIARPVVSDAQIDLDAILDWAEALDAEEFLNDEPIHEGTAQAGGASTITLDTGASAADDFYNGAKVAIANGTGQGQVRTISDYVGSTRVATVSEAWDEQPDNTSEFRILEIEKTGRTFDAKFDRDLTKFEALKTIAAAGRAAYATSPAGKYSIVRDIPQTVVRQHFSPRNARDFRWTRAFTELPHAVKVEFPDAGNDFVVNEETIYRDGFDADTATKIERLQLPGVTDRWQAYKDGRYWLDAAILRPEIYEFTADWEHLCVQRGDLIRVTYDLPLWGVGAGRIKSVVTDSADDVTHIICDEPFPMDSGELYAVRIRAYNGDSILANVVTNPGDSTTIAFETPISAAPLPQPGDLVLYGERGRESVELIVKEIHPQRDFNARIVCVDAAPEIHVGDAIPIPPRDPQTTIPPALNPPSPPAPVIASEIVRSGTCQSGSFADTIKLDAGASAVDGAYDAMTVKIVGGTGAGQVRIIRDNGYEGATKVARIQPNWTITPNASSEFEIYRSKIVSGDDAAVISGDGSVTNKMIVPIETPIIPPGVELRSLQGRLRTYVSVSEALNDALLGNGNAVSIQRALNDYYAWANASVSPYFDWDKNQIVFDNVASGVIYEVQARYITKAGVVSEWSEVRSHTVDAADTGPLKAKVDAIEQVVQDGEVLLADSKRIIFGDDFDVHWAWNNSLGRLELRDSSNTVLLHITAGGVLTLVFDQIFGSNANNYIDLDALGNMQFYSRASFQVVLDSDNNDANTRAFIWYRNGLATALAALTEAGLLGIGTASPTAMLDIESTNGLANTAYLRVRESRGAGNNARVHLSVTNNANDAYFEVQRAGVGSWTFGLDGSDSNAFVLGWNATLGNGLRLRVETGGAARWYSHLYVDGNLGVGNTSPGYKADITGDLRTTTGGHSNDFWRVTKSGISTNLMDGVGLLNELLGEETTDDSTSSTSWVVSYSLAVRVDEHRAIFDCQWEGRTENGDVTPEGAETKVILADTSGGTTANQKMIYLGGSYYGTNGAWSPVTDFIPLIQGLMEHDATTWSNGRSIIFTGNLTPGTYYLNFLVRSTDGINPAHIRNKRVYVNT